ncbi:MAG: hypothetical protein AAGD96_34610, partial [Chloroflexota bacterium]
SQEFLYELLEIQREVYEYRLYYPQFVLLKVFASSLSEQALKEGELESAKVNLAIQLKALCHQSIVAKNTATDSPFLDPPIDNLQSLLPNEFVAENIQIGSALDLWPTAAYLLEELPRMWW